jgi:pentatricopeptide repeat protein
MWKLVLCFLLNLALIRLIGSKFNGGTILGATAFQTCPSSQFRHRPVEVVGKDTAVVLAAAKQSDFVPKSGPNPEKAIRREFNTGQPVTTPGTNRHPGPKPPSKKKSNAKNLNSEIFRLRKQKNGAELAEERLRKGIREMLENADTVQELLRSKNSTRKLKQYPDEVTFNSVLSSLAKNARRDSTAAARAEQLLQKMVELADQFPQLRPTIFTYNAVLEAYTKHCNSKNPKREHQCQSAVLRIFQRVQRDPKLEPNSFTNNLVLTSNARSSAEWQTMERWALDCLDNYNATSTTPDRNTYNQLFQCYASRGEYNKAEELLQKILNSKESDLIESNNLKVCPVWFNLVLKALAVSTREGLDGSTAGERADRLLRQMYDLYKSGYDDKIHPGTSTYNHVLNVHSRLGDTERAEELVKALESAFLRAPIDDVVLQPDRITSTTLIKTYATRQRNKQGITSSQISYDIAVNATRIFKSMESLSNAGWKNMSPNDVTCKFTSNGFRLSPAVPSTFRSPLIAHG